jgi:hypothetical protein
LRYHLQELSVAVARRLVAVLDAARDAPHGVAAELDAVVAEITDIQRDLAYEMAGPPIGGAADLSSLSRMLDLQRRMMSLMDRIETISSRPITNYLEQRQRTPLEDRSHSGWSTARPQRATHYDGAQLQTALPALRDWEPPHQIPAPTYDVLHQHAAYDAHGARTAPFLDRALASNGGSGTASMARWPHFSPTARWGILPMAICIVSALLTTTVNRLMQSDSSGILQHSEDVAKRGDRLDARLTSDEPASAAPEQSAARPSTRLEETQRIAVVPAAVQPATITVSPPPPQSDRGLDALNPDAPSVVVLATHQEPSAAQQAFVKLKERFPDILGAAEADIEAVQTQDGTTWHRLSLLPPVPRSEAKDLCKRLRAAGYAGCWVRSRSGE